MLRPSVAKISSRAVPALTRPASAAATATATASAPKVSKKEGDISDAFVSLSGAQRDPLPDRFRRLKCDLVRGREAEIVESWTRLLRQLRKENDYIAEKGSDVIPQVDFADLESGCEKLQGEIKKRGALVVRGVIPEAEARAYKEEVEEYVRKNPHTRAFPPNDPQVYELYWSGPQLKARSHPSLLRVQRHLMSFLWHTSSPSAQISLTNPLTYADRLRIRQPGDASFALGPHIDGGSVERWEPGGYGLGGVYDRVLAGDWEGYDPWDASGRVAAVSNLYDGLGACSMFRMWQGWMSMSRAGPGEGTLLVNPLMHMATAYVLLRPFFTAVDASKKGAAFLDEGNWAFAGVDGMTSDLQGASPGHGQELTDELHPHLELARTMVHVPNIKPGDFVAWHCDTIHSVDKVHAGKSDSSVLYIPVCPVTDINAAYVARQRAAFRAGTPGPDFPGGEGESRHVGRPSEEALRGWTDGAGRQAFGLERLAVRDAALPGEREVVERANGILGF
ncbi:DNA ligase [Purpureocillium lavendulum]|uniref:DNA ligase n=1 Tax=Purpureocillium lavendulum TaxID=1247861 RepID=A0AB34FQ44_9HYPO|nr:DNA ligase [Purpureocillium lavendulum]